ncbi:YkgJ family cysteine cluster protein [Methylocystis sp. JAN1]|uniref:YkgJ family cysteine cluster protein n=1 Tax=Methylocystis sp. JAN1 TaxID=3397211 RepID=UPI003FA32EB5
MEDAGPASFFQATTRAFGATIAGRWERPDLVAALCAQAFDSFEKNVTLQSEGAPAIACKGECAACCRLRVVATAPEIFLLARFVDANTQAFAARNVRLAERISDTAQAIGNLGEAERMAARRYCPLIENDLCLAYRLRPLACRGHAALDREACVSAAEGGGEEPAVSTPHLVVRSLVQNAMLNAVRQARLAWGLYELTQGLRIACGSSGLLDAWLRGGDPLAPATIPDFDLAEAASLFDAIAHA